MALASMIWLIKWKGLDDTGDEYPKCDSFDDPSEEEQPPPSTIPEFSTIGIIITLLIALVVIGWLVRKERRK